MAGTGSSSNCVLMFAGSNNLTTWTNIFQFTMFVTGTIIEYTNGSFEPDLHFTYGSNNLNSTCFKVETITFPNTTHYLYYRSIGVSGNAPSASWGQVAFQIAP